MAERLPPIAEDDEQRRPDPRARPLDHRPGGRLVEATLWPNLEHIGVGSDNLVTVFGEYQAREGRASPLTDSNRPYH